MFHASHVITFAETTSLPPRGSGKVCVHSIIYPPETPTCGISLGILYYNLACVDYWLYCRVLALIQCLDQYFGYGIMHNVLLMLLAKTTSQYHHMLQNYICYFK